MPVGEFRGRRLIVQAGEQEVTEAAALVNATKVVKRNSSVQIGLSREVTWHIGDTRHYLHFGIEHPYGTAFVFASGLAQDSADELTVMFADYFEPPGDEELLNGVDRSVRTVHSRIWLSTTDQ